MSSNDSTAKEQSFLFNVNKIFLVIHLLMLFMFSSLGVDLMAGVNALGHYCGIAGNGFHCYMQER